MKEETLTFKQYDSVQAVSYFKSGKVTVKRGLLFKFRYQDCECVFALTKSSDLGRYTYGDIIKNPDIEIHNAADDRVHKLLSCRIVLIEKAIENS